MPRRDPDEPPRHARPLREALRRYVDPDLVAALATAEAATGRGAALSLARDRCLADGVARLRAGEWIAWAREGAPTGPWRHLSADAWAMVRAPVDLRTGRPRRDDVWLGCVQVRGSDLRYYDVVVCPAARHRRPSEAALRAALEAADAKQGKPLTLRQAEEIARDMGASRECGRAAYHQLRRREQ